MNADKRIDELFAGGVTTDIDQVVYEVPEVMPNEFNLQMP